ncbi:hypothetical protein SMACR_00537 [Sordaria macrospora]|uniref:Copper acquisition factor BIM1-like domain-containing protein n=1 Tax=Sordaria macrospora TaxID=5147 RepID=A0A8S8ZZJ9_SORMA|nr:hypothetical protein SMACR_00537 [Sordaria macrospora]KAH7627493.1 hypothetical protein B0T09DRAFT_184781 [Sordaria sp. MPI-SDFR-AT-0083]WPJ59289.1 hypothetical protein SMAC4_00537 [Sordaria macrospora]
MVSATLLFAAAVAPLASAHFGLEYPAWRADTLQSDTNYSQWQYPCAGVPAATSTSGNRTDWPLKGGSIKLDLHHPWEYVFVNLGLGGNVTNFNYTLTGPTFWNVTGAGTLCVDLPLPEGLNPSDGQEGSIQVVTVGESGSALYNCADITFRANATALSKDECKTDEKVSFAQIKEQSGNSTDDGASADDAKSGASIVGLNNVALTAVVGMALSFVTGMVL